ncbi:capsular exopolysaccharide family [Desulfomicrobium apsheronum]|uniref:non-specific protein-tyrosine kinase n=1 Tax=Desulfomicrobium apsheronum TaxID=52560 RepID=A0A1I3UTV6_9BACT|nr:polysaccharide biosynthesis tyrosine autokinase [Desulfomicrobium apsheronum]SFJ86420.1 capsular exopolysaccharide family [Desulfomicrobium apsheronum]
MTNNFDSIAEEVHLRDYIRILAKRKWLVITAFVLIVASTALFTFTMDPVYEATAKIVIEKENPNVVSIEEVFALDAADSDYSQTQFEILQSRTVARKVIERLDLGNTEEFNPAPKDDAISTVKQALREAIDSVKIAVRSILTPKDKLEQALAEESDSRLVDNFLSRLTIDPVRNSRVVNVRFKAKDPVLAARIADTVTQVFIELGLETKLMAVQDAVSWLSNRIQEERAKVEEAQMRFQKYKEENSIITNFSSGTEQVTQQKLAELNSKAIEAEAARVEAETRYNQTKGISSNSLDSVAEILASPVIQSIKASEMSVQNSLAEMSKKYGANHPQIIAIKAELNELSKRKSAEVQKIVQSLKNNFELALAKEKSLKEALRSQEQGALSLSKKSIQYGVLQREAESAKEVYDLLVKRFKETTLTENMKTVNVRVVDKAETPTQPIKPRKAMNMLLALVLGITAGTGLAFFAEYLDNTLKTPEDVARFLHMPYLGMIPSIIDIDNNSMAEVFVHNDPKSVASESVRGLRSNLLFSKADQMPQVVLLTSATPKEGKTLVAVNLGAAMAQAGCKTLLIGADMRRPRAHKILELENGAGLSNILSSVSSVDEVIKPTGIPNLDIITAGPVPPNPSELLGSKRMPELIASLRERYEHIIIDTPPATAVTDAAVLAQHADGVVLISKAFVTPKELVRSAIEALQKINAKIFGVVLNSVNMSKEGAYYYQYAYYYYYGEKGNKKRRG